MDVEGLGRQQKSDVLVTEDPLHLGRNVGIYERATTTQQEVVQAITAGIPTKVSGIAETAPEVVS